MNNISSHLTSTIVITILGWPTVITILGWHVLVIIQYHTVLRTQQQLQNSNSRPSHSREPNPPFSMRIVYTRYYNLDFPYCLATAVQNNLQEPGCVMGHTLGRLHGRHPDNEHDMDPDTELSNAMAYIVTSGHAAGDQGHYLVKNEIRINQRNVEAGSPMYHGFAPSRGDVARRDKDNFIGLIGGENPNQFMFVRFVVTEIVVGNDEIPEIMTHWGNITFAGGTTWWFGHGTMKSNPIRMSQDALPTLLFTEEGRSTLAAVVQRDFGGGYTVSYDREMFLAMPKIQLQGPNMTWLEEELRRLPLVFINNGNTTRRCMHTYQIVDLDGGDVESIDAMLEENMRVG